MRARHRFVAYGLAILALAATGASLQSPQDTTFTISRADEVYASRDEWEVSYVLSPDNLEDMADEQYVEIEGWLVYVARSGRSLRKLEDGDYHLALSSKRALRSPTSGNNDKNLLTCEIIPQVRLSNTDFLRESVRRLEDYRAASSSEREDLMDDTFLRVKVRGYLRFGSEPGHDGVTDFPYGDGDEIEGHWEIHPVESVIDATTGEVLMGPAATYEWSGMEIDERYHIDADEWNDTDNGSNYAKIRGKVLTIEENGDSGDYTITLDPTDNDFGQEVVALIPEYYVKKSSSSATKVAFKTGVCRLFGASLKVGDTATFYGMRDWVFDLEEGIVIPILAPVEGIK